MRLAALLLAGLLTAACGSATGEESSSVVAATSTSGDVPTTTASDVSSTSGPVDSSVDVCRGRAEKWEPGAVYVAPCFIEPVSSAPTREGWLSSSAGDDWILVRWRDPDEPFLVWVGIVAARSSDAPSVVINEIGFISGIDPVSEVVEITVADLPGLRIDVEGAEEAVARNIACTTGSAITFLADEPGHPIASTSYNKGRIGVGACQRAAIWVVEVGDRSITIIGGTEDPARHEEAVVKIEELFGFMSFGIGGGS